MATAGRDSRTAPHAPRPGPPGVAEPATRAYRRAFDAMPDALALADADGVVVAANAALGTLLGEPAAALRGRPVAQLTGAAPPGRTVRADAVPLAGEPPGTLVRFTDVTGVIDLTEPEPGEHVSRLQAAIDALGEFATRASHDLKSPLLAIRGNADLLRDRWDALTPAERGELVARIRGAAGRALDMVDGLLAGARGDREPAPPPCDAKALLVAAAATVGLAPGELKTSGRWPPVAAGAADVSSVFTNLLDNAHHYARGGDGSLRVTVTARPVAGWLVVHYRDDGPGLPDPERAFEPFPPGPTGEGRNPASTGLGLALVRRAVRRWGGDVQALPARRGSDIVLRIPLARPAESPPG